MQFYKNQITIFMLILHFFSFKTLCPPDYCRGRETLQNLCEQIPGDALLYSMFKVDAEPVKCPLKGPFTFTYNRGHGECRSPVSNIASCTEDSRLLLSFQACPDVSGTESTSECFFLNYSYQTKIVCYKFIYLT